MKAGYIRSIRLSRYSPCEREPIMDWVIRWPLIRKKPSTPSEPSVKVSV